MTGWRLSGFHVAVDEVITKHTHTHTDLSSTYSITGNIEQNLSCVLTPFMKTHLMC